MSVIAVGARDDLLRTIFVEMFLKESFLELRATVVDAQNIAKFAIL